MTGFFRRGTARLKPAVLVLLVGLRIAIGLGWRPDEIYSVELS